MKATCIILIVDYVWLKLPLSLISSKIVSIKCAISEIRELTIRCNNLQLCKIVNAKINIKRYLLQLRLATLGGICNYHLMRVKQWNDSYNTRNLPLFVLIRHELLSGFTPTIRSSLFVNALLHMLVPIAQNICIYDTQSIWFKVYRNL